MSTQSFSFKMLALLMGSTIWCLLTQKVLSVPVVVQSKQPPIGEVKIDPSKASKASKIGLTTIEGTITGKGPYLSEIKCKNVWVFLRGNDLVPQVEKKPEKETPKNNSSPVIVIDAPPEYPKLTERIKATGNNVAKKCQYTIVVPKNLIGKKVRVDIEQDSGYYSYYSLVGWENPLVVNKDQMLQDKNLSIDTYEIH